MQTAEHYSGVILAGDHALVLESFAWACDTDVPTILLLVDEGIVSPEARDPVLCFGGESVARARRVLRLQRDFEANLQSVAVMIDLLDENDRLRTELRRLGKLNV
jgi:chaperone modulatory protein CbpM